jgi:hypothetical protein
MMNPIWVMKTPIQKTNKVVVIDHCSFMFRSIYSWASVKAIPPKHLYIKSIVACLKRLHLSPDDLILLAVDSPEGSWRKEIDANYKSDRKEKRILQKDKDGEFINWQYHFNEFNNLVEQLSASTSIIPICIDSLEADDIMARAPVYFNQNEVILVSPDSDVDMVSVYKNARIFSPITKSFKEIKNPYSLLASKIQKETTDNLVTPILTQLDFEKREKIVNLISLPAEIAEQIDIVFNNLNVNKDVDIYKLPKEYRQLILSIYNDYIEIKKKKIKKQKKLF